MLENQKFDGDKVKQLRLDLDLKQAELAEIIGVDRSRICRYEKGEQPAYQVLVKLANALEVRVSDLFYYSAKA